MKVNFIVVKKDKNYTCIDNGIFKDTNLSAKAKGVLCTMLSLPKEWKYSIEGLATLFSDGERAINSALQELEENKYLKRERVYENGKIASWKYTIYEVKYNDNVEIQNLDIQNVEVEKSTQLNTNNNKVLNNNKVKSIGARFTPPSLEEVNSYCKERKNSIDAQHFIDYYTARNWELKKGIKVKDWRACVRTWESYDNNKHTEAVPTYDDNDVLTMDEKELEKLLENRGKK